MNRVMIVMMCMVAVMLISGSANAAITIETVAVGNPGNATDTHLNGGVTHGEVPYAYKIGTYEVTAGQYVAFLNAVAATDTYGLYNASMVSATSYRRPQITRVGASGSYTYDFSGRPAGTTEADWANRPVNYVSWGDAARFTNWLHNGQPTGAQGLTTTEDGAYYLNGANTNAALMAVSREADWKWAIPSENEWYKAAYYDPATASYFDYPTGSDTAPGYDMADASGNNANTKAATGPIFPIDPPYFTTKAGEFQNSDSPYGTFDQGGNVYEWNEGIYSDGTLRGYRGGDFPNSPDNMRAVAYASTQPLSENPIGLMIIGFRVVALQEPTAGAVPEPAGLAVLGLGLIGLARRRRS